MRRLAFSAALLLGASTAWGLDQVFLEPVVPTSPTLKAQGGISTANASGYEALFTNPASFAEDKASLTLFDFETTANLSLTNLTRILGARESWTNTNYLDDTNPMASLANDLLTESGLGGNVAFGAGWVGKNLGIGFNVQSQVMAKGQTLLGSTVNLDNTIQGVIGMGWPFDVGLGTLRLGVALRPMQKIYSAIPATDLMKYGGDLASYTVSSGFGLGWDIGARWDYANFRTGLVVRDAGGTLFSFKDFPASEMISKFGFPSSTGNSSGNTLYRIPTVIGLGTQWVPDMGSLASLVQPSVGLDFQIPIKDEFTQPSFWTWTHIGAEARFLQFLAIRAGMNQGYPTFGLGFQVLVVDFNLAVYSDELGRYSGLGRRPALSLDWAFRI